MSYCTDKDWWRDLEKDEEPDIAIRDFCKRNEAGNICRKTLAQIMGMGHHFSTSEFACFGLLFRDIATLTDKEKVAFEMAFAVARAEYDKKLNAVLLTDPRFANNAKIILLLRSFNPEDLGNELKDKLQLNISLRKEA